MIATLTIQTERWALPRPFTISRGSRTAVEVCTVTLEAGGVQGRGEATPYARYGESPASVEGELALFHQPIPIAELPSRIGALPPGAARNAVDCAWWDWQCKHEGRRIADRLGWPALAPLTTAYTLSVAPPEAMEAAAREAAHRPLLKIKTGGDGVPERLRAVRRGAPGSRLIVDANEAWPEAELPALLHLCAELGYEMVEQPLPAGQDGSLATIDHPVPVYADESFHTAADLPKLEGLYDGVNLKLDKTGGFSEALRVLESLPRHRFQLMVGCMLGTSLAMAPAFVIAQRAGLVDLDAPLLLGSDREAGFRYHGSEMEPPDAALWG